MYTTQKTTNPVQTSEDLQILIQEVKAAQVKYAEYSQEQVDHIFKQAARAANAARIPLAKMAVEETGMGVVEDKVIKNHFASEYIYNKYKNEKTCGIIEDDKQFGIQRIAEPVGILAGIVPTTNPTSTAIFKALLAVKTRNGIIFSPHPRAKKCTIEAAKIVLDAAVAAGAPAGIIGWIDEPTVALSQQLMQHPQINLILATGGPAMVRAAYSSGHASLGVGSGNTPAVIDETAHIKMAVSSILISKTFDNGMICASEQSVIVLDDVYEDVQQEFFSRGAYFLNDLEKQMISHVIRYNATDAPFKQAIFPQYEYPNAKWRYAKIADHLHLGGGMEDVKVDLLIAAVEKLKQDMEIPGTIKDVIKTDEKTFHEKLETMAEQAFDDQCTGANPRYPLISDLQDLYIKAYWGNLGQ